VRPSVVVDRVWKKFRLGERHDSLRDLLPAIVSRLYRRRLQDELATAEFWALSDVSFSVQRGEALGIIGPNGAGKSTVLKLLTRILRPNRGHCHLEGRVGALIEVAAGFHPELTGRENIYLQGAIMGMKRDYIASRFDEIVTFAGTENFVDTQIKRYSSGMQARLGFAIAAHMNPDVLLVDEVLSVGDISFQARCMERMQQHIREGVTVVFVSHNLQAVASLCKRALVLGAGSLQFDGPVEEAMDAYLRASQAGSRRPDTEPRFTLECVSFVTADGEPAHTLAPHTACVVRAHIKCDTDSPPCAFSFDFERTRDLFYCYGLNVEDIGVARRAYVAGEVVVVTFKFIAHFARGHYRINLNIRDSSLMCFYLFAENLANFTIVEEASYGGVVEVEPHCDVRLEH
jgi:ABC-type polysaccharide/polyol phosphate transport system ATPase subunit